MADTGLHWFVGFTKPSHEKKVAEALEKMGVEYYLPVQKVRRRWSDRIKVLDKMVIPRMIFIRTTLQERVSYLELISGLYAFMSVKGPYTPVIVPDKQMADFKFMVDNANAEVLFETRPLAPGDPVEVMTGQLAGIRGELVRVDGAKYVAIRLGTLGAALVEVPIESVERYIPDEDEDK